MEEEIMATKAEETTTPQTDTEKAEKPTGVQFSAVVTDPTLIGELNQIKRIRDHANQSELVREALAEYAVNHAEEVKAFRDFMASRGVAV